MEKLVVLTLIGDNLQQDIWVSLQIWQEGKQYLGGSEGRLPPCPDLLIKYEYWQYNLRSLAPPTTRMKIKTNTKGNTIEKFYARQREEWYKDCRQAESDLSKLMNTWLLSDSFRPIQDKLNEKLTCNDQARIIICSSNMQIKKLPWHYWYWLNQYHRQAEIIFSNTNNEPITNILRNKIKILVILGNSEGIDTQTDLRLLSKNLPDAEIKSLFKPALKQLNEYLWNQAWDIIFFAGHSETDQDIGIIYINDQEYIEIQNLRYALQEVISKGLKLAIFNSCDGLGLAYELEKLNISNLIVMRDIVADEVAQQFLNDLLRCFAIENKPLHLAELEARKKLQGLENSFPSASSMPVIYQNFADEPQYWQDWFKKPQPRPWKEIVKVVGVSLVVTSLIMWGRSLQILQLIELSAYDLLISHSQVEQPPDGRILIVEITNKDMEKYTDKKSNSLSNDIIVTLIKKLEQYNPRAIGLDIFRDRIKPNQDLLDLFQQQDNLIATFTIGDSEQPAIEPPDGVPSIQTGFADLEIDHDKTVRRQLLSTNRYYAFSFLLAFHYLSADNIDIAITPQNELGFGNIIFKRLDTRNRGYSLLDGKSNQILPNFRSKIPKKITLTEVLDESIKPSDIENKVILIGVTDPTIPDDHKTPFSPIPIRGLFIHAQMVSQILSVVQDQQPQLSILPLWLEYLCIYTCSLIGGVIVCSYRSLRHPLILSMGMTFGLYLICLHIMTTQAIWMPLGSSVIALFITEGILLVYCKKLKI
ncbi:CHASE2 domain-containing protein [Anabaena azotica]|uniref:CHASE2 domain-containing protein n=1 Tax=Anabaena azotica TaxID=197653 RepID=UPI0039A67535